MLLQLSHFPPFIPLCPAAPSHLHAPSPQFMSMGHKYKFFGFHISHSILNLPLSILCLLFMLPIPYTFPPILSPPSPPPH